MNSFFTETEPAVESELIDLGAVSMTVLRTLDDEVLRRALRHVVEQTGYGRVTEDYREAAVD